jgi:hypothetical protein
MKLCPQCDFIYEDDQSICDMDGKELVSSPATDVTAQSFATPVSATPVLVSDVLPVESAGRRRRNFALVTVVGIVLAALVIAIYLARTYQLRSQRTPETSSTDRSAGEIPPQPTSDTSGQPALPDLVSTQTPSADTALPEESGKQANESSVETDQASLGSSASSSPLSKSKESLAHTRLTPGPVSAGAPSGSSRGPVIVRLNNGAAIRADEAWEKREGVWYRQGGVVTFLKRSQVRTIERLPSSTSRSKSAATNAGEKSKQAEPAADAKKDSKVTSFLKRTGRILKKPFKF